MNWSISAEHYLIASKIGNMTPGERKIHMVDLVTQYQNIQTEIDEAVLAVMRSAAYINGPAVKAFAAHLERYLAVEHAIPCGNGTDALQIALMALDLKPGDEVILPSFTYVATAEVVALLNLKPIMVDVDPATFNVTAELIAPHITPQTKAIVPVNLFGQCCDLEPIMNLAKAHQIAVVEDNAQAIGADYQFSDGRTQKAGTIADIGCTSFYPAKNLGAYGDGGAMFTNDDELAHRLRMIANHGQQKRYYHDRVGVNSRLDSIQAAILDIKLTYLDDYAAARNEVALYYDRALQDISGLTTPHRASYSSHVFHQYTLKVEGGKRDALRAYLQEKGVPSMIYYPVPLHQQKAYSVYGTDDFSLPVTEELCRSVISLPIHTEMDNEILTYITEQVARFMQ